MERISTMTQKESIYKYMQLNLTGSKQTMSILTQIHKPTDKPIICTITGDSGMGKTSLAASFPKPVFIRVEDGLQSIPEAERPDAFPIIDSVQQLWDQLKALIMEKHDYKTVVIDSVTKLDRIFEKHIIDTDPNAPKSINQALGGYGAGHAAVGSLHGRVRDAATKLQEKGINVVFIAHAEIGTMEIPNEEAHSRYSLRLNKKSVPAYVDDVDMVAFIKLDTVVTKEKKAFSDGARVIIAYASAICISKNRYGIEEDIDFVKGTNPLADYVPCLKLKKEKK